MESTKNANSQSNVFIVPSCKGKRPPSRGYKVITPKQTLFCMRNFKNAVDFHPKEKLACKNTWYRDVRSTHIRNKRLLDLPFPTPKCCAEIYNISLDEQKLKKLKKYNLTRPVRTITNNLEMESLEVCKPERVPPDSNLCKPRAVIFPECYILPESEPDSDSEENMVYEYCKSGSVSECSMCSNSPVCGTRKKIHRVMKSDWRDLLHAPEVEFCRDRINEEISKHKLGRNFKLKLKNKL